jgi:hypothetical protein
MVQIMVLITYLVDEVDEEELGLERKPRPDVSVIHVVD